VTLADFTTAIERIVAGLEKTDRAYLSSTNSLDLIPNDSCARLTTPLD
jgi:hypothetical protein